MKILYFLDYGKEYGGAVHTLLQQALRMQELGHNILVYVSNYYGDEIDEGYSRMLKQMGVDFKRACYYISPEPEDIDVVNLDEEYEGVKSTIESYGPDVVHSVQLNPIVELACRELEIPHVMSIYVLSDDFFRINYLDIFPHYLVCDSEFCAKQWKKHFGVEYSCIRTMVRDLLWDCNQNKEINSSVIKCICVGAVYDGKNQLEVIKGFQKALACGFNGTLEIYGYTRGPYARLCEEYIENNSHEDAIRICGFNPNMTDVYNEADVLVCGSLRESYPNVISEAMANGLVVISTPVGGVTELISDRENGFITEGFNGEDICEKLLELKTYVDNEQVESIRRKSILTAKKEHHPSVIGERLEIFYHKVINEYKDHNLDIIPTIEDVRKKYHSIIQKYNYRKEEFSDKKTIAVKLWYIGYIEELIKEAVRTEKSFYLWGAGHYGRIVLELLEVFFEEVCIKGIIDSRAVGTMRGYSIFSPEQVLHRRDVVIIVSLGVGQWDVIHKLEDCSKKHGEDYFVFAPRTW